MANCGKDCGCSACKKRSTANSDEDLTECVDSCEGDEECVDECLEETATENAKRSNAAKEAHALTQLAVSRTVKTSPGKQLLKKAAAVRSYAESAKSHHDTRERHGGAARHAAHYHRLCHATHQELADGHRHKADYFGSSGDKSKADAHAQAAKFHQMASALHAKACELTKNSKPKGQPTMKTNGLPVFRGGENALEVPQNILFNAMPGDFGPTVEVSPSELRAMGIGPPAGAGSDHAGFNPNDTGHSFPFGPPGGDPKGVWPRPDQQLGYEPEDEDEDDGSETDDEELQGQLDTQAPLPSFDSAGQPIHMTGNRRQARLPVFNHFGQAVTGEEERPQARVTTNRRAPVLNSADVALELPPDPFSGVRWSR